MPSSSPVALVTGSAKRVGATIARRLHRAGFDLALHYRRSAADMQALCAELNTARPGSACAFAADLAEPADVEALVPAVLAQFGRLDALVNNASGYYATPIGAIQAGQWDDLFAANARAPLFLAQAAAPALRAGRGAIVNIVDIYAERPLPGHTVYCMAKAALAMLTLSLARELGPDVRVNAVAPGNVLWSENFAKAETETIVRERTALARQGSPDDIAEAVRWLIVDAGYVTGQILRVDGGRSVFV
ncbi:MAG TPA: pteridine reductase [Xanthomonadales bacterium]|nr:pteridine reductase [Xanthomonadales bacterium]